MKLKRLFTLTLAALAILLYSCGGQTFEEQIKSDITGKMATGICDSIPQGAIISNIKVGEIVDIGMQGMTDVSIEFDYEKNGVTKHHSSAMLYLKKGSRYKLAALGGCEFDMK